MHKRAARKAGLSLHDYKKQLHHRRQLATQRAEEAQERAYANAERTAKRRDRSPEELKAIASSYVLRRYHSNPAVKEQMKANARRASAKHRGAVIVDDVDLKAIAERDNWLCHICRKRVTESDWSLDHLIPVSKGGQHAAANVALAHRSCNSSRGAGRLPAQLRLLG